MSVEKVPSLPPKSVVMNTFHFYKDQLMRDNDSALPIQLVVSNAEHFSHLLAALMNHPNAEEKMRGGVKEILVRRSKAINRLGIVEDVCCCYVVRTDNTEADFSLFKCFGARSWKDQGNHFDAASGSLVKREEDV